VDPDKKDMYHRDEAPPLARKSYPLPASPEPPRPYLQAGAGPAPHTHHAHRTRVRRRRGEHSSRVTLFNKLLWLSLGGVVLLYAAALGYTQYKAKRRAAHAPPPAAAPEKPAIPLATRTDQPTPIANDIKNWKQALILTSEGSAEAEAGHSGGEAKLRRAIELAPELLAARLELARFLEHKQDYAGAEAELRRVLARDPERTTARLQLASVFLSGGQPENALAAARWVIEADPFSEDAHEIAASALTALNKPQDALSHLRRLATIKRDDPTVQNNLGVALMAINDYRNAQNIFRTVLQSDPGNSVAFYNLAVSHARQQAVTECVETLTQASRRFGSAFVLAWAKSEDFAPIRDDPRFQQFIEFGASHPTPPAETNETAAAEAPAEPAATP